MKRRYKKYLLHCVIIENSASSLSIPDIVKGVTMLTTGFLKPGMKLVKLLSRNLGGLIPSSYTEILSDSTESTSSEAAEESLANENVVDLFQDLGYSEGDEDWQTP